VSRKVGGGVDTYFLNDRWLGGAPFRVRFRRLFDLAVDKSCSMSTMFSLGWEDRGARDDCRCRRRSYQWSVRLYFTIFLCNLMSQISGSGSLTL